MSIYKSAINKPVTTILVFVAVIVIGLFCFMQLPIAQFPEMEPPYVTVMTTYPGANASEVEENVTKQVENSLNSVDGLKTITSTSKDNISMVVLEMEWGTDLDEVMNDIRSYIDMLKDNLPSGCSNPYIFKFSSSQLPVINYSVTAKESYPGLDKLLNDIVVPQLNRINGIGNISISGAPNRYVYVDLDQYKLDTYNLTVEAVGSAISANNINLSSGVIKMDKEQYNLQVRSEYQESSEIEDIVVATTMTGQKIFVRDIATVRDTIKDLTLDQKINGEDGVGISVTRRSDANAVQICKDVRKEMEKIAKQLPSDVKIQLLYDTSEDIEDAIGSLEESILYALLFVVLVVLLFLGKWRATFIISITIPIALIVSFIYLALANSSLNIISLCSLTVAIGMVVDDAIVVLENITKHVERGTSPREAAIYATNEVWTSVIATTLVIVAVFVPLTMLEGMAGILFKELGWIVTIVVCASTLVAISLTPMLASKLLKEKELKVDEFGHLIEVKRKEGFYQKYIIGFLDKIDNFYSKVLNACLKHKGVTLVIATLLFIASMTPLVTGQIGTDFMQESDSGRVSVSVELQNGTKIDETIKLARILEGRFKELVPEIERISTTAGSDDDAGIGAMFSSTTNSKISMTVVCLKKEERERGIQEIAEVMRQELATYPQIIRYQCDASSGMGAGGSSTVDIDIYGYDFDQTGAFAEELRNMINEKVAGARDIVISRDRDRSEIKVNFDKEKLAMHGLNATVASTYVRNRVNGLSAGFLKEDGEEYTILVRLQESNRNSISDVLNLTIPTATGAQIKLNELATVEEYFSPPTIERKSRQRYLKLSVTPYGVSLGELAAEITAVLSQVSVPNGVTTDISGSFEEMQDSFADMALLLLLIMLLVYIVMASQFESFSKPAIIMLSIPFALSGVVLSLWITGTSLDLIGALGVVMLVGIVVKNGIVLVDYINLMRDRGHGLDEAIVLSGHSRLRPVLMTAFTTILGMLPMALSTGSGSEMWHPMGIVVIGGLLVSTIITLIVVPVFYGLVSRTGERDKESKEREKYIFMQLSTNEEN